MSFFLINLNLTYEKTITLLYYKPRAKLFRELQGPHFITYLDSCTEGGPSLLT